MIEKLPNSHKPASRTLTRLLSDLFGTDHERLGLVLYSMDAEGSEQLIRQGHFPGRTFWQMRMGTSLPGNQFVLSAFGVVARLLLLDGKHLTGLPVAAVMSYFAGGESCWSGRV